MILDPDSEIQLKLNIDFKPATQSVEYILTQMGLLNNIAYCLAVKYGAVVRKAQGGWAIATEKIPDLLKAVKDGTASVSIPCTYWQTYLKKFWRGACNSLPFIRKMRDRFVECGNLFKFDKVQAGTTRKPPELQQVDLFRILWLYKIFEDELINRGYQIEDIGFHSFEGEVKAHKGAFMVELFKAVLKASYRRIVRPSALQLEAIYRQVVESLDPHILNTSLESLIEKLSLHQLNSPCISQGELNY
ncbi:MAG: hypothetical protein WBB28_01735 [Crinalium sp.]